MGASKPLIKVLDCVLPIEVRVTLGLVTGELVTAVLVTGVLSTGSHK
jgi:hypothetical protein